MSKLVMVFGSLVSLCVLTGCPASDDGASTGGSGGSSGSAGSSGGGSSSGGSSTVATPGEIECDGTTCSADTECCAATVNGFVCQTLDTQECNIEANGLASAFCDDSADCPDGQVCCGEMSPETERRICSTAPCQLGFESCVEGGACSTDGLTCSARSDGRTSASDHICVVENHRVNCGDTACEGDSFICCWDSDNGTGECVSEWETCRKKNVDILRFIGLECLSPSDCANYYPCSMGAGSDSYCGPPAGTGAYCQTLDDCPAMPGGFQPKTCEEQTDPPVVPLPGLKICTY